MLGEQGLAQEIPWYEFPLILHSVMLGEEELQRIPWAEFPLIIECMILGEAEL